MKQTDARINDERDQRLLRKLEETLQKGLVQSNRIEIAPLESLVTTETSGLKLEKPEAPSNVRPLRKS